MSLGHIAGWVVFVEIEAPGHVDLHNEKKYLVAYKLVLSLTHIVPEIG
jgi:hypothetical protein